MADIRRVKRGTVDEGPRAPERRAADILQAGGPGTRTVRGGPAPQRDSCACMARVVSAALSAARESNTSSTPNSWAT